MKNKKKKTKKKKHLNTIFYLDNVEEVVNVFTYLEPCFNSYI